MKFVFFIFVVAAAAVAYNIHSCELDNPAEKEGMRANCVFFHTNAHTLQSYTGCTTHQRHACNLKSLWDFFFHCSSRVGPISLHHRVRVCVRVLLFFSLLDRKRERVREISMNEENDERKR